MSIKRVTSSDVAKLAGVSRTTVSLVLNDVQGINIREETRERVLRAAKDLNYVPDAAAQALASRRSKIIGLIITRDPQLFATDAYLSQILNSLVTSVRESGMRLLLDIIEGEHGRESYSQLVHSKHIDGIIFSGPRFNDEALQLLEEENFPTVLMGQLPGSGFCSVDVDNFLAAKKAVSHLINLGHKKIACITNADISYTAALDRYKGYREALDDAGIPFESDLLGFGDFDLESGYEQMKIILDKTPLPSAVFVASDVVAFGAMAAIREFGFEIPADIAVVGFDNVPLARYIDPYLTTIHLPATELAKCAFEILEKLIRKEPIEKKQILLDTHLIIRDSCGAHYGTHR
ncbi:MAG: LacI family transcriptional regulator [Anaerolineaceae bacterium]|nr:LacI family transcriptional regulator [Anaerolineaceae bacterium]